MMKHHETKIHNIRFKTFVIQTLRKSGLAYSIYTCTINETKPLNDCFYIFIIFPSGVMFYIQFLHVFYTFLILHVLDEMVLVCVPLYPIVSR